MPKLKQPDPLQKVALDVLFRYVVRYCDQLSVNGSLEDLRQGVSMIKERVCNYIPWHLLAEFCGRFLDEFYSHERPKSHHKAALEMVMDTEIVGLRCKGRIMIDLDPEDVHRFQRLEELDLTFFSDGVPQSLGNFRFHDLTTFIFPKYCRNLHLKVIGQNCLKLQVLKVPKSSVTEGLRALRKCSELRVVDISSCEVSHGGVNFLLSITKKIEELSLRDDSGCFYDSDIFSHLDSAVCPSMRRFVFQNNWDVRPSPLRAIVAKFPNLSFLKIICTTGEDLSPLLSLKSLTGLEICFDANLRWGDEITQTWESLKVLLTFIGGNITTLKLSCWDHGFFWYEEELNFFCETCPNIEHLAFDIGGGVVVIPPFPKLKELYPRVAIEFEQIDILTLPALEFNKLPNLETLSIVNFGMNAQAIESIILDNVKFPNLSIIETNCLKPKDLAHIEHTIKSNNLDFKIKNDQRYSSYIKYRYGGSGDSDENVNDSE